MSVLGIADTGFIYAYLDPDDEHHGWAVEQFQRFPSFITCEAVVAEAAYLTGSRLKRPTLVIEMLAAGVLEVAYSLHGDEENVAALMEKYADEAETVARREAVAATGLSYNTARKYLQLVRAEGATTGE